MSEQRIAKRKQPYGARGLSLAAVSLAALLAPACAHESYVWADSLPHEVYEQQAYRIRADDVVHVQIWNQEQLTTEAKVRPDGKITIALIGDVAVLGRTPPEAAEVIKAHLDESGLVVDARVAVAVRERRANHVTVLGEVETPGQVLLESGDTVLHILAKAGGMTEFADRERIFVIRRAPEPLRVRFSYEKITRGGGRGLDFVLQDRDILVVE